MADTPAPVAPLVLHVHLTLPAELLEALRAFLAPVERPAPLPAPVTAAGSPPAAAAPSAPVPSRSPVWTDERKAVVRREWPRGTEAPEILRMLKALPGKPLPAPAVRRLGIKAAELGLRRPEQPAAPRTTIPARVPAVATGPVQAEWEQLERWAADRGFAQRLDHRDREASLALVNAKRRELGLPPFVLVPRRALPAR